MTTTAHEDQFTAAPEPVREPLSREAILRRNIADMEVALKQQTERAIQAERDFESLISDDNTIQEYAYELGGTESGEYHLTAQDIVRIAAKASEPYTSALRSLASYVGAGGYNADTVDADVFEEKIRWGIGEIMARMEKAEAELAKLRGQKPVAWCDPVEFNDDPWSFQGFRRRTSNYPTMALYAAPIPAVHAEWREVMSKLVGIVESSTKFHGCDDVTKQARALLQSAEVHPDDKWQLTPAPTHPADRDAREVRHD